VRPPADDGSNQRGGQRATYHHVLGTRFVRVVPK
jgi:hypothetical protein